MNTNARRLVMWDVDHTLIEAQRFHYELFTEAFERFAGRPPESLPVMAGRTDRDSATETLALNTPDAAPDDLEIFAELLRSTMNDRRDHFRARATPTDGAVTALRTLRDDPSVIQTVVTGNLKELALAKLDALGMADYLDFEVGGFGWDDLDRARLVSISLERASAKYGTPFDDHNAVVIGDTPRDVDAAHRGGAKAISVALGASSFEELAAAGGDVVLQGLSDLRLIVESLNHLTLTGGSARHATANL